MITIHARRPAPYYILPYYRACILTFLRAAPFYHHPPVSQYLFSVQRASRFSGYTTGWGVPRVTAGVSFRPIGNLPPLRYGLLPPRRLFCDAGWRFYHCSV